MRNYIHSKFVLLIIFGLFLILFVVFSTKISFHDTAEYITVAKYLGGTNNFDIFTSHSIIYPFIISLFLKIWPNFIIIRLVNVLWLFLIGVILLYLNKKSFIIFAFSPLTWIISIQTTPILPASFLFLLSFVFYKKNKLILSGIFLGLSFATYTPLVLVALFFILIYFWDRKFKDFVIYLIAFLIGFLPRMIIDYYYFKMPFYTLLRFFGTNFIIALGLHPTTKNFEMISNLEVLLIFITISPLLFRLYKLNFKKYKREVLFLMILFFIILLRAALLKYFLIISPIIILFLVKVFDKKDIKWHCILSVIIICVLTWNYFLFNEDRLIKEDLQNIIKDYDTNYIVTGPFEAPTLAQFIWEDKPYFIWWDVYNAELNNQTKLRGYNFEFQSKIPLKDKLEISADFNIQKNKDYDSFIMVTKKNDQEFSELKYYKLIKCYQLLCVYE